MLCIVRNIVRTGMSIEHIKSLEALYYATYSLFLSLSLLFTIVTVNVINSSTLQCFRFYKVCCCYDHFKENATLKFYTHKLLKWHWEMRGKSLATNSTHFSILHSGLCLKADHDNCDVGGSGLIAEILLKQTRTHTQILLRKLNSFRFNNLGKQTADE